MVFILKEGNASHEKHRKMLLLRNTEVDELVVGGRKNDRQKLVAPN